MNEIDQNQFTERQCDSIPNKTVRELLTARINKLEGEAKAARIQLETLSPDILDMDERSVRILLR